MIEIRRGEERGYADHGWLRSFHSFSFANYYDPRHVGFGPLRVINEDRVAGGTGFGKHPHRDMEIISYVLSGGLEHKDSMGTGSVIRPGDVQCMSAGSGVLHSEYNHSKDELVHFLQIWIEPDQEGVKPEYQQKVFTDDAKRGKWCVIASPDARNGSVRIHQNALIFSALVDGAEQLEYELTPDRKAYIHVALGDVTVNGQALHAGDAIKIINESNVVIGAGKDAEILLFDLP